MNKSELDTYVDDHQTLLYALSDQLWESPEVSLNESQSAAAIAEALSEHGFEVEWNIGEIPTAFRASFGSGSPTIGLLGEYDALPGFSQAIAAEKRPITSGGPGHACGHNLLATGCLGAALALRDAIEDGHLSATVVYYGCPAEEVLVGKSFMAQRGAFSELDAALSWHPGDLSWARMDSGPALDSLVFDFTGVAAHTANPTGGRSALKAAQLMNVGVEHVREHVPADVKISYAMVNGGRSPGIVPDHATVWYAIRAGDLDQVKAVAEWVTEVAEGAALMSRTEVEKTTVSSCHSVVHNHRLSELLHDNMVDLAPIEYTESEQEFARELRDTKDQSAIDEKIATQTSGLSDELRAEIADHGLYSYPVETFNENKVSPSTDVAEVSRITPLGRIRAAVWPVGTAPHTWQAVVGSGSFGKRGCVFVSKVLARTAYDLATDASNLQAAREEFEATTGGRPYESPLPADAEPPIERVKELLSNSG